MLRPSNGIADCPCLLRSRGGGEGLRHLQKNILRNSAITLHHLRRVSREVSLQDLEGAVRVFQRKIPVEIGYLLRLAATVLCMPPAKRRVPGSFIRVLAGSAAVEPGGGVIFLLFRIPT